MDSPRDDGDAHRVESTDALIAENKLDTEAEEAWIVDAINNIGQILIAAEYAAIEKRIEKFERKARQSNITSASGNKEIIVNTADNQDSENEVSENDVGENEANEDQVKENQVKENQVKENQVSEYQVSKNQVSENQVSEDQVTEKKASENRVSDEETTKQESTVWVSRPDSPRTTAKKGRNPFGNHPNPLACNPVDLSTIPGFAKNEKGKGKGVDVVPRIKITSASISSTTPPASTSSTTSLQTKPALNEAALKKQRCSKIRPQDSHPQYLILSKSDGEKISSFLRNPDVFRTSPSITSFIHGGNGTGCEDFLGAAGDEDEGAIGELYRILLRIVKYYIHTKSYANGTLNPLITPSTPLRTALNTILVSSYPTTTEKEVLKRYTRALATAVGHARDGVVIDTSYIFGKGLQEFPGVLRGVFGGSGVGEIGGEEKKGKREGKRKWLEREARREGERKEKLYGEFCRELAGLGA